MQPSLSKNILSPVLKLSCNAVAIFSDTKDERSGTGIGSLSKTAAAHAVQRWAQQYYCRISANIVVL